MLYGKKIVGLIFSVCFAVIISLTISPLVEAKTYVMRFGSPVEKPNIRNNIIRYMQKQLPRVTNGRVTVEGYFASIGGEREIMEMLILGTMDAYMGSTGPLSALTREPLALIFDVPFLYKSWDHALYVGRGKIGQELNKRLIKKGIRILDFFAQAPRALYFRKTPVRKPADLQGIKIRVMENPLYIAMYKEFGAIPTPMAWPEVYTSLQTGAIDGVDGALGSGLSAKHTEMVKYVTFLGPYMITNNILLLSEKWWQSLPDDLKQHVQSVAREAAMYTTGRILENLEQLKTEWINLGIKFTDVDREAFFALAKRIYPMVEEKIGKDVIQEIIRMGEVK